MLDMNKPHAQVTQTECPRCLSVMTEEAMINHYQVCTSCGYHFRMPAAARIHLVTDEGSFKEMDHDLVSKNPISFQGYEEKIVQAQKKSELDDAVVTGTAKIDGQDCVLGVMSFQFMGGSMGSVVGEKITRAILHGADTNTPVILFTASGGARMQEGIFSLMQMAKTANAAALLDDLRVPLFIVFTHPTTGGVTASFAMLGDVALAEPGALIGFAGPRVIEGTINKKLPPGFQSAEFQQEKGFVDKVIPRKELKHTLSFLLKTHRGV
ncbi:MAG: acetyl-CoA carboxylase, carboxyltransferase subunit beta [Spirochaetales bacterium]|nr:acetyl-CoA carboxylase, carboxyltransferase subunit beta [Spirochaetales bacterium]